MGSLGKRIAHRFPSFPPLLVLLRKPLFQRDSISESDGRQCLSSIDESCPGRGLDRTYLRIGRAMSWPSPVSPPLGRGSEHDARTRLCIGPRVVMTQRDTQAAADIRQPCRIDSPLRTSKLDRTGERYPWCSDAICGATREENTPVERRVVSSDEFSFVEPGVQGRPEFTEGRRAAHIFPVEAMDFSEQELRRGGPNQERPRSLDPTATCRSKADRTRAVPAVIGSLEVDCDEGTHGGKLYHADGDKARSQGLNRSKLNHERMGKIPNT